MNSTELQWLRGNIKLQMKNICRKQKMLEINIFFFKSYSQLGSCNRPFMYPSLYLQAKAKWAEFCLWLRMSGGWRGFVLISPFFTTYVPGHMQWELKLPVVLVKSQVALSTFGASMHFSKETQTAGTGPTKGVGSRALRCTAVCSQALAVSSIRADRGIWAP